MAADSFDRGFERGRQDALAGREWRQPRAAQSPRKQHGDPGYFAFWEGYSTGYRTGLDERQAEEAMQQ